MSDIFESRIELIGDKEVFSVTDVKEDDKVDIVEGCDIDKLCVFICDDNIELGEVWFKVFNIDEIGVLVWIGVFNVDEETWVLFWLKVFIDDEIGKTREEVCEIWVLSTVNSELSKVSEYAFWVIDESFISKIEELSDFKFSKFSDLIKLSEKEIIFVVKIDGVSVFKSVSALCVSISLIVSVFFKLPGIIFSEAVDKGEFVIDGWYGWQFFSSLLKE